MHKQILKFFKLDYDWKLYFISKVFKIDLYPSNKISFLRNIYDFILLKYFYKLKNIKLLEIVKLKTFEKKQLIIPERSGSSFIRKTMDDYLKLFNDKFLDNKKISHLYIRSSDFYGLSMDNLDSNFFNKLSNFIFFSRYPYGRKSSFLNQNFEKTIIVIRQPMHVIKSYFIFINKNMSEEQLMQNLPYIKKISMRNIRFLKEIVKIKNDNILFIKYEDLIDDNETNFIKIIKFYKLNLNKELIKKAIDINDKEKFIKKSVITKKISNNLNLQIEDTINKEFSKNNYENQKYYNEIFLVE